jgi:hypothetical protein
MPKTKTAAATTTITTTSKDSKIQERLIKEMKKWDSKMQPLVDASRASERLTEKDFAIRINAKA